MAAARRKRVDVNEMPLLLAVEDAAGKLNISRALMYKLLARGEVKSLRIGRRRLVAMWAIEQYVGGPFTSVA